jgi:anaerobic magnesium-protoporphyrin IX monomethyl ester cyclase
MRQHGYDVALFDAMLADSAAEWQAALAQHQPRWAIIYEDSFNYLSKMCLLAMRDAAHTMIAMAKRRAAPSFCAAPTPPTTRRPTCKPGPILCCWARGKRR